MLIYYLILTSLSFFYVILRSYDYNMHVVEGLLPDNFMNLCLVTLLSSEQCSQFERIRSNGKQNIQFKKTKLIINRAEARSVKTAIPLFPRFRQHHVTHVRWSAYICIFHLVGWNWDLKPGHGH